eukprot:m.222452 g.222452  ORF g.222452 m.222452 type:complete len:61 (-) comp54174_c0_seq47:1117-1299(-)
MMKIDQRGMEKPLSESFRQMATACAASNRMHLGFDFHKECARMRYDRVSLLMVPPIAFCS